MAAPSDTTRGTPSGIMLEEGLGCKIAFSRLPTFSVKELETKPPALDNGEPIKITTHFNSRYHTKVSQALIDLKPFTVKVQYDPNSLNQAITTLIGPTADGAITVSFPDGTKYTFYGYLQIFDPDALVPGQLPTATLTIVPTCWDKTNRVEAGPVVTSVAGT